MAENIIQIKSLPGIKRDGTRFEGDNYVDGQWARFQRGLPRKMGGYRAINKYLTDIVRNMLDYTQNGLTYVHCGSASKVERFYIDGSNNTSVISDRTPAALTASDSNMWQFDIETKLVGGVPTAMLIAQVAPNLDCLCNSVGGQLFYGDLFAITPLLEITTIPTGFSCTGGIVALHPYTFAFGNNGYIAWSIPGDPTDFTGSGSGSVNVTSQKIVKGMALRGGPGNSPSGLFWSADSLIRGSFVGGTALFQFDTISTQTSILSPNTVIEYDGIFYWCGVDRFLMFNGVVREIENNLNINWFFDGLNYTYRQKVFATKVPRFGEIWWCYPRGDATECTHAVIYNVRENTWYDTELPNGGRSAGLFPTVFRKPLMTGTIPTVNPTYYRVTEDDDARITEEGELRVTEESEGESFRLWIHEQGVDEIDGQDIQPLQSYFETADISLPVQSQVNNAIQVQIIEPDFVQSGPLIVQVMGRRNARSAEVEGPIMTITETATTPQEEVVYFKEQRRELRFRFESNVIGGDYQMGLVLAHVQPGDGTTRS
jgi:hypothetical protein